MEAKAFEKRRELLSYLIKGRRRRELMVAFAAGFVGALLNTPGALAQSPVFVGDFESGKIDEAKWLRDEEGGCSISAVRDPVRAGRYAARFEAGPESRCELVAWVDTTILGRLKREPFQRDRWYGFSVYIPARRQAHARNEVIAQWHASRDSFFFEGGRGPPLALRLHRRNWWITYDWDANLISDGEFKGDQSLWSAPYELGKWTDWVFHVRWSHKDDGLTEIWKDGEKIMTRKGPNAYNDLRGVYLKIGNYHPGLRRTVYIDEVRVGDEHSTYSTVMPGLGAPE